MRDNKTSQPAQNYDAEINKTQPMHGLFLSESLTLVEVVNPQPRVWLDAGCGTGLLVERALPMFPETRFVLADPSEAMLAVARAKLGRESNIEFLAAGTENIACPEGSFDVITAVLTHHYFDADTRAVVTANCYRLLTVGGVYITFETVRPSAERAIEIGLRRWARAQVRAGKDEEASRKYMTRFDVEYHPITISAHIELLRQVGFSMVEILWVSGLQAGFFAIK